MSIGDNAASPADENEASPASPTTTTQNSSSGDPAADPSAKVETAEVESSQAEPPAADSSEPESPGSESPGSESPAPESPGRDASQPSETSTPGPLGKLVRGDGPLAARGIGIAKPASPTASPEALANVGTGQSPKPQKKPKSKHPRPRVAGDQPEKPRATEKRPSETKRVAVPNLRDALSDDIQAELEAELAAADVEAMLSGPAGMSDRSEPLDDGTQVHGQVLKIHDENVFVALGGPDEGVVPLVQFKEEPSIGTSVEVIVRGVSRDDGLYALSLPGSAIEVTDWEDLEEGSVVEATVTGNNSGGLECKVGGVKGFIPISQITEYRVEDTSEFVDQKFLCVITEANVRRGNLVLSRRAILEREREEKRKEQLEQIEVGDQLEGIVRSVKDFGAFVDLGGLDGLIHISKLSWDRVKHPSEVLEVGQKVQVIIDKIDKDAGKISLSYRDLLDNPWDTAEAEFSVGSIHRGTVTRIAVFGCFVKLTAGVEGFGAH